MAYPSVKLSLYICLLFFSANIISTESTCLLGEYYLIRPTTVPELTLDATTSQVQLQGYSGSLPQLWEFLCADEPGLFYIINSFNLKYMDVDRTSDPPSIIINTVDYSSYQQWQLDSYGYIFNAQKKLYLTVTGPDAAGSFLQLSPKDETLTQTFTIQRKV